MKGVLYIRAFVLTLPYGWRHYESVALGKNVK